MITSKWLIRVMRVLFWMAFRIGSKDIAWTTLRDKMMLVKGLLWDGFKERKWRLQGSSVVAVLVVKIRRK